jgi:hypothetical protein
MNDKTIKKFVLNGVGNEFKLKCHYEYLFMVMHERANEEKSLQVFWRNFPIDEKQKKKKNTKLSPWQRKKRGSNMKIDFSFSFRCSLSLL